MPNTDPLDGASPAPSARRSRQSEPSFAASKPTEPPELPPRFQVRGLLGRGGMGAVYEVSDSFLGHDVALKCLYGLEPEDRYRTKAEFRSLASIVHPNLVTLYELVATDRVCFFTMERVRGVDFVSDVRSGPASGRYDRLRDRARQLALAIAAVHRAGALHRDIKSSNVLVTTTGRVVLLDFGLLSLVSETASEESLAGTLEYMAPEQLWLAPATTASDWYGFGATLYEAAVGALPFRGAPFEISVQKRAAASPRPSDAVPGFPEDLDQLISRSLSADPSARPTVAEILSCLGAGEPDGPVWLGPPSSTSSTPFVSREAELALLTSELAAVRGGVSRVVRVEGPSGVGKTELIRAFLKNERRPSDVVLQGRCHPRESVAFNAVDPVIDHLTQKLLRFPAEERLELLRGELGALARIFPVLASIEELGSNREEAPIEHDVGRLRRLAFLELRELLVRLGERHDVIIWLDDLHWGDVDSGDLLSELLRGPAPPRLLAILSFRTEGGDGGPCLTALAEQGLFSDPSSRIEVPPLDEQRSVELLTFANVPERNPAIELERMAREARGSPFILGEMARYLEERRGSPVPSDLDLSEMLLSRAGRLTQIGRRMLEIVAIAGGPIERQVLLRAAGAPSAEQHTVHLLERMSLLRIGANSNSIEIYHHRIREELARALSEDGRKKHHVAIADSLAASSEPSPQKVVEHYIAGGHLDGARRYVVSAALQASSVFAFERAAHFYRLAVDLGATELTECEVQTRLAHALANAGRGREAGRAFVSAAQALGAENRPEPARELSLQRWAAEHFLKSGHDEEGTAVLRAMLRNFGVRYPEHRGAMLAYGLGLRFRPRVKFQSRSVGVPSPHVNLERVDALFVVAMGLGTLDHARASYFSARGLIESAESGDPARFARASAIEATVWAAVPGRFFQDRAASIVREADALVDPATMPYEASVLFGAKAALAWFRGDFAASLASADAGVAILTDNCHGIAFELALLHNYGHAALALRGEIKELTSRVLSLYDEAEQRDDRVLARSCTLGHAVMAWLAMDRSEQALERALRGLAWWPSSRHTTAHYFNYLAQGQALLYRGEAERAFACTVHHWPALRSSFLLGVPCARDELWHLNARTAVAALCELTAGTRAVESPSRKRLFRAAANAARAMEAHGLACGQAWAFLIKAGLAFIRGHTAEGLSALGRAVVLSDDSGMSLYREAARYCLAIRTPGGARSPGEDDLGWFHAREIKRPLAMIRMLVPGCLPEELTQRGTA